MKTRERRSDDVGLLFNFNCRPTIEIIVRKINALIAIINAINSQPNKYLA